MISDQIDYQKVRTAFHKELTLASEGKSSSLSFITYSLPKSPLVTTGVVQGIVIGGTNYVVSTIRILKSGKQKVVNHHWGKLPIFADLKTLVDFLTTHLDPRADAVGINFGFPLKPIKGDFGEIDGKLIHGTKEHTFIGVTTSIGEIAREIYQIKYKKDIPVSVANDSVCLTLSGDGSENGSFINGTGTNMCLKLVDKKKITIVSLESGNFDKFPVTSVIKRLDTKSAVKGYYLEKTIAGKYMAEYFNEKAKQLGIIIEPLKTSNQVSELAERESNKPETKLAQALMERSAYLVAAITTGAYDFAGAPDKYTIIGEGSVLWKGWNYRKNIKIQFSNLGIPDHTIKFKHVEDSSIKGALGLLI
jgi:hexokinase